MAAKIKKGDKVVILAGKDKGKTGSVTQVFPDVTKATVQGLNLVRRHTKQTASNDAGIFTKEAPIHLSNVMPLDPSTGKGTRIRTEVKDGVKHRVAVASGTDLGRIGKKK